MDFKISRILIVMITILMIIFSIGLSACNTADESGIISGDGKVDSSGGVTSFEECVAAGNPVMESYPRQCRHNDDLFVEEIDEPVEPPVDDNTGKPDISQIHTCTEEQKAAEMCTMQYDPVCGNNGKTYGNGCSACASNEIDSYVKGECAVVTDENVGGDAKECGECPMLSPPAPGWCDDGTVMPGQKDECGCQMPPICAKPKKEDAITMAEQSECAEQGDIDESDIMFNPNSNTWWIGIDLFEEKPGCNPACVVSEGNVEINWRCTGLYE